MGTHAMIGIWNEEDGSVTASYVHYDGYVEGVGDTLEKYYHTPEAAQAVANVGYLSGLGTDLKLSVEKSAHKDKPAVPYESVEQYMKNGCDYAGAEYLYLYDGAAWFVAKRYDADTRFTDVRTVLWG